MHSQRTLQRLLASVAARLERFPLNVQVCWAPAAALGDAQYEHWASCSMPTRKRPVWVIAFSDALRTAPLFVLDWLMLHECLHVRLPACTSGGGGGCHHYYFRQAERSHPAFLQATAWLDAHG